MCVSRAAQAVVGQQNATPAPTPPPASQGADALKLGGADKSRGAVGRQALRIGNKANPAGNPPIVQ